MTDWIDFISLDYHHCPHYDWVKPGLLVVFRSGLAGLFVARRRTLPVRMIRA